MGSKSSTREGATGFRKGLPLYINAALENSYEMFLVALRDIAEASRGQGGFRSRVEIRCGGRRSSIYWRQ